MAGMQEWIHSLDEGPGARRLGGIALVMALLCLTAFYDFNCFQSYSSPEAMDAAQVARNLSEGRGFTTEFIRPLSLHLLQHHLNERIDELKKKLPPEIKSWTPAQRAPMEKLVALAELDGPHPDIANAPVYPVVLAGLMSALPFDFDNAQRPNALRHQPEILITLLNQFFFLIAVLLTYRLARRIFDTQVAWLAAAAMGGTELLWRFSASGLSTMLLLVIFLGIVWCLVLLEQGVEEALYGPAKLLGLAALTGALMGLGMLTRYSFGCLIFPVVVFMAVYLGARRHQLCLVMLVVFGAVIAPWMGRNYELSGSPIGTAGYAIYEGTSSFPDARLERSLNPSFSRLGAGDLTEKFFTNFRKILSDDLPKLGGNWFAAFFLAGLLVPFRSVGLRRLRYFLLGALAVFIVAQALIRTHHSELRPEVNGENLLVLLAPLLACFGAALFFTLLDQLRGVVAQMRAVLMALFLGLACAPLLVSLLFLRTSPLAWPPYDPPHIRQLSHYLTTDEWLMSDMPWAVAWYGHRQCVWLTLNPKKDFQDVCEIKPVHALYLTQNSFDRKFLSDWVYGEDAGWDGFFEDLMFKKEVPTGFPLQNAPADKYFPLQVFLSDRNRWAAPAK